MCTRKIYTKKNPPVFILGQLQKAVWQGEVAKKELKSSIWNRILPWRRRYYMHIIREGETAKKRLEELWESLPDE
jgi:hypothetical protein